jgi:hypothetical protein
VDVEAVQSAIWIQKVNYLYSLQEMLALGVLQFRLEQIPKAAPVARLHARRPCRAKIRSGAAPCG